MYKYEKPQVVSQQSDLPAQTAAFAGPGNLLQNNHYSVFGKEKAMGISWMEYVNSNYNICGLCGNSGVVDTRKIATAAGIDVGGLHYCVCPNGRALKRLGVNLEEHLLQLTRRIPKVDFTAVCSSLRKFMADNVGKSTLVKTDFVNHVRSLGWEWDEFEQTLRAYASLADNIFDKIRGF